ncbi:MAG: bifunctional folylpolyglutamate synthase/dihydrofolate synthase [Kiritimatiellae bacterium]|nr:bifunctional folylpolyglutamate synthase/dihydrofolate synthase [Kiritimatiellia bacterium]
MRPGLDAILRVCAALGTPQEGIRAVHVAGTNGKGAVCAILDSCLRAAGYRVGRYTSPHLVQLNERFFLNGAPVSDETLEKHSLSVKNAISNWGSSPENGGLSPDELTFFEALTAVAFDLFAAAKPDFAVLETGLGGRLDATNVCHPVVTVITRIGLDHCDWLGGTIAEIASEKAGIIKKGVPVVVGANENEALDVIKRRADEVGAPFVYAPDIASSDEIPSNFSLMGSFNRENAVTALAVLRTMGVSGFERGFASVVWPGRFQRVDSFVVDGAHNPPAARALASALSEGPRLENLIAGFCGDKDVDEVLRIIAPFVRRGFAVKTNNPRSLSAEATAEKMKLAGIDAIPCDSLKNAIAQAGTVPTVICGSLFLAGEALVELGAYPWGQSPDMRGQSPRFDPSERLK